MISYEIKMTRPGRVYAVVTNDDGSTFGQWFKGEQIADIAALDDAVYETVARVNLQAVGFELPPGIASQVGKRRNPPTRP